MKTYTDARGVVHVVTSRFPGWTCCNVRLEGATEPNSSRFPTCLWCVINRLWSPR